MLPHNTKPRWHINWLRPRLPWIKQAIRPAEISDGLCKIIIARENVLEDADYNKIAPNHFAVELTPENYFQFFKPLEKGLIQQWRDRLLEHIMTANSRLGRTEYRLGGQLLIEIRPASDIKDNQARILCCIEPELDSASDKSPKNIIDRGREIAFLELINGDRRWPLFPGDNTIGRDAGCDIFLDLPLIQEKRLVSAQHATIRIEEDQCLLFDGGPSGKPSANGTFINSQSISMQGVPLKEGDIIILAAINPRYPRLDTPGVASFRFRKVLLDAR